jgi:MFS family permease
MKHSLRALKHPNFRLFFAGQTVSVIGTWIHAVAMSWLVYRLSGSALLLGLTGFASMAPLFFFAPLTGLLADWVDRQRLLLITQVLAAIHALTMAVAAYADVLSAWHVIALATLLGIIQAADTPLRQAFLPDMVTARDDLPSAVALSAFMQQAGRLIGPTIAGLLMAVSGEALCFLVNAMSKLGVIAAVAAMRIEERPRARRQARVLADLGEGLRYAWDTVPVRILLPTLAVVSFMIAPYQALMPIFAAEIFHGGADTLGYLMGAAGLGGGIAVLVLAGRKDVRGLGRIILAAVVTAGAALVAFSQTRWLWLAYVLLFFVGAGMLVVITGTSTILQTIVEDEKRGRVMSLYTMSFLGMIPMGSLAAGALAERIGAIATLSLSGAGCMGAGLVLWMKMPVLRSHIRAHYVRLGIVRD